MCAPILEGVRFPSLDKLHHTYPSVYPPHVRTTHDYAAHYKPPTMMQKLLLATGVATALAAPASTKHTQPWLYPEFDTRGPSNWHLLKGKKYPECGLKSQSPVNIAGVKNGNANLQPLQTNYHTASGLDVTNNGHSIDVVPKNKAGNRLVDPNQGNKIYDLLGIHFHSPSEHGIGGGLYDMELHFVHKAAPDADQPASAVNFTDHTLAVIGVLFREVETQNALLGWVEKPLPQTPLGAFPHYDNQDAEYDNVALSYPDLKFDFAGLLGNQAYYTYSGSLTTPPCTETVKWYVKAEVNHVGRVQLKQLRDAMSFTGELAFKAAFAAEYKYKRFGNNRPLQDLNGRTIEHFTEINTLVPTPVPTAVPTAVPSTQSPPVHVYDKHNRNRDLGIAGVVLAVVALLLAFAAVGLAAAKGGSSAPAATAQNEPAAVVVEEPKVAADGQ